MSYPSQSDFSIAAPDPFFPPAWWTYTRDDGSLNVCESTGASALRRIRSVLGLSPAPIWDQALQSALLAQANSYDSSQPNTGWAAVVSDLSSNAITPLTLRFALWLGYYQANGMRFDAVGIPSGTVPPSFGQTLPDSVDSLTCFDPRQDPAPDQLSAADLAAAQSQSTYGIRLHAGENPPAPAPAIAAGPSGLSTRAIVGILAVFVVSVGAIAYVNRDRISKPAKPNPRRSRR